MTIERDTAFPGSPPPRSGGARDLATALAEHRGVGPGFHFLRHALAGVILFMHCRGALIENATSDAGLGAGPVVRLGAAAADAAAAQGSILYEAYRPVAFGLVGMFFALSGFLIVGSALRTRHAGPFLANRCLRILPALTVEVALCSLVLGPWLTSLPLRDYFADPAFFRYFGNIVGHVSFDLPGLFKANPWPGLVNANLWTLPAEFWCYFFMVGIMLTGTVAMRGWLTTAVLAAVAVALGLGLYDPITFTVRVGRTHFTTWYVVLMFFIGVVFFLNARRIVLSFRLFLLCGALYYVMNMLQFLDVLSGVFLTYCMVYIGMQKFSWFDRLLPVDVSYGVYLYGFPIIQSAVLLLLPHLQGTSFIARLAVVFLSVTAVTGLFAWLSWRYVEKPALSLRRLVLRGRRSDAVAAA